MANYMFDTMIFNRILDGIITIFPKGDSRYFVTHIQLDEINSTKDDSRRRDLLRVFNQACGSKIPTESAVWDISKLDEAKWSDETIQPTESAVLGHSRVGMAKLSDGTLYDSLLRELDKAKPKEHDSNIRDTLIGETSIKQGYTLVTDDIALYEAVKKLGGKVSKSAEFQQQTNM